MFLFSSEPVPFSTAKVVGAMSRQTLLFFTTWPAVYTPTPPPDPNLFPANDNLLGGGLPQSRLPANTEKVRRISNKTSFMKIRKRTLQSLVGLLFSCTVDLQFWRRRLVNPKKKSFAEPAHVAECWSVTLLKQNLRSILTIVSLL